MNLLRLATINRRKTDGAVIKAEVHTEWIEEILK